MGVTRSGGCAVHVAPIWESARGRTEEQCPPHHTGPPARPKLMQIATRVAVVRPAGARPCAATRNSVPPPYGAPRQAQAHADRHGRRRHYGARAHGRAPLRGTGSPRPYGVPQPGPSTCRSPRASPSFGARAHGRARNSVPPTVRPPPPPRPSSCRSLRASPSFGLRAHGRAPLRETVSPPTVRATHQA